MKILSTFVLGGRGTLCLMGDFERHLTLCCPLRCLSLSGKMTGAYLLPSAGLSTTHLHIDGKSMGSLQCVVNITNDQFKLQCCWRKPSPTAMGPKSWQKVTAQSSQGQMHIKIKLHRIRCSNVGKCWRFVPSFVRVLHFIVRPRVH